MLGRRKDGPTPQAKRGSYHVLPLRALFPAAAHWTRSNLVRAGFVGDFRLARLRCVWARNSDQGMRFTRAPQVMAT